jgi:hypoxanthine phosphoribosyltransferase
MLSFPGKDSRMKPKKLKVARLHSAKEIRRQVTKLGRQLSRKFKGKDPVFLVSLKGAFIFASDLVRAMSGVSSNISFIQPSSYRDKMKSAGKVNFLINLNDSVTGRHVIIVEDIVDSGLTAEKLYKLIRKQRPASITFVALVVKPQCFETDVKVDYFCFKYRGSRFLVGYGLDFGQYSRNLPYIGTIPRQ